MRVHTKSKNYLIIRSLSPKNHNLLNNNNTPEGNDSNQDTYIEDNVGNSENIASKVSRATKRLLPFNEEGLKETTETPNLQGRKLRNRIVNNFL